MKISFRQGIVRCKTAAFSGAPGSTPTMLYIQPNGSGTSVDFFASQQDPTVITFAHYNANYLVEETRTLSAAWGGGVEQIIGAAKDIKNDPLNSSGTQYLYWDIDLGTGAIRRGWTDKAFIMSVSEPINVLEDQHWFDLSKNVMKVRRNDGDGYWIDKVRVFAGVYTSTGTLIPFIPSITGSQVQINGDFEAGNILLGANSKPLRQSDGTFATTATNFIVQQTGGQNIKFDSAVVFAQAAVNIPKFSLVVFNSDRRIILCSSLNKNHFVAGITLSNLNQNDNGQIISNGAVQNDQWNWPTSSFGKPVFCSVNGEPTLTPPVTGISQQVGFVYDTNSIYINILPPVRL